MLLRTASWLCLLLLAPPVRAQGPAPIDDATRNAARELAHRGTDAFERGDYAAAQDLFRRSYALLPAPTLSLREARALEKLGRWVEAAEAYVRTVRAPLDSSSPEPFRNAVLIAQNELSALRPRIPRLTIAIGGAAAHEPSLRVELDGKPLSPALIGVEMPVDPGVHRIEAQSVSQQGRAEIELAPGTRRQLVLELEANPTAPAPRATGPAAGAPAIDQRTWAIVALGAGGAALSVGLVAGLVAVERYEDAERTCPDFRCERGSSGEDDVDAFRSLRTVSTVSYLVGAAAVGAGLGLWLTAAPSSARSGAVTAFVGPGNAGIRGRF